MARDGICLGVFSICCGWTDGWMDGLGPGEAWDGSEGRTAEEWNISVSPKRSRPKSFKFFRYHHHVFISRPASGEFYLCMSLCPCCCIAAQAAKENDRNLSSGHRANQSNYFRYNLSPNLTLLLRPWRGHQQRTAACCREMCVSARASTCSLPVDNYCYIVFVARCVIVQIANPDTRTATRKVQHN